MRVIQHVPLVEWFLFVSMSLHTVAVAKRSNIGDVDTSLSQFARVSGVAQAFFTYNWASTNNDNNLVTSDDLHLLPLSLLQQPCNEDEVITNNTPIAIRGGSAGGNQMNPLICRSKKHEHNNPSWWYNRMASISTTSTTDDDNDDDNIGFNDNEFHFIPRNKRGRTPPSEISSRTVVVDESLPPPPLPSYGDDGFAGISSSTNLEDVPLPQHPQEDIDNEDDHSRSPTRATHPLHLFGDHSDDSISEDEEEYLSGHLYHTETSTTDTQSDGAFPHSPIVYRYFGRSRVRRTDKSESIPFIFLGPSVDHWKKAGQVLASRGFNVMACERVQQQDESESNVGKSKSKKKPIQLQEDAEAALPQDEEGHNLILSILDALKWTKAILVGCDNEAAIAIEAALRLAPDKVAGLVLCGDLSSADELVSTLQSQESDYRPGRHPSLFSIDKYLRKNLDCPFTVVWDGDVPHTNQKGGTSVEIPGKNRCLILGGGIAPHRRLPEHFAWVLTRFVEEQVASRKSADMPPIISSEIMGNGGSSSTDSNKNNKSQRVDLPFGLGNIFSSGAFLVAGRVVAAAIFYASCLNVGICQYENIRSGMVGFKTRWEIVASWRKRLPQMLGGLLQGIGSWITFSNRKENDIISNSHDDTVLLRPSVDFDHDQNFETDASNNNETDEDNDIDDDMGSDASDSEEEEEEEEHPRITFLDRVIC